MVWVPFSAAIDCIHHMSARLGDFYASVRPQIQQSTNYKIHVVLDVTHIPHAALNDRRHHTIVRRIATQSLPVLVRMGFADMAERSVTLRTD